MKLGYLENLDKFYIKTVMPRITKANRRWSKEGKILLQKSYEWRGETEKAQTPEKEMKVKFLLCMFLGWGSINFLEWDPCSWPNSNEIASEKQGWGPPSFPQKSA